MEIYHTANKSGPFFGSIENFIAHQVMHRDAFCLGFFFVLVFFFLPLFYFPFVKEF